MNLEKKFKDRVCQECNKTFKVEVIEGAFNWLPEIYCSDKCSEDSKRKAEASLNKKIDTKCEICGEKYFYTLKESHKNRVRERLCSEECFNIEQEKKELDRIKGWIASVIPPKYVNIDTDRRNLLESSKNDSLFITGGVGSGKTVFMSSLAKLAMKNNKNVKWILYPDFIMKLQNAYKTGTISIDMGRGLHSKEMTPYELADSIAKYDGILFIDDLGAEKLTDFVRQTTYLIINHREQYLLQTVITSNFSLAQIDNQIDMRISSRIAGMCKVLKFSGADRRIKNEAT